MPYAEYYIEINIVKMKPTIHIKRGGKDGKLMES
jgi:hypothetical protein